MEDKKAMFLERLRQSGGIISSACESAGVSRSCYYKWRDGDAAFALAADEVMEAQTDLVESKLMDLIEEGDTTATIFYLKTRGKGRGWTEKAVPARSAKGGKDDEARREQMRRKVKNKKDYLVRLLKEQGKYTAELAPQAALAARWLVEAETLGDALLALGGDVIDVEYSREGNERKSVNPLVRLYNETAERAQRSLRALGMNVDAKERKGDNDVFGDFMEQFGSDD